MVVSFVIPSFSVAAYACSVADGCISGYRPGGGNHTSGSTGSGSGPLSGYNALQFTGAVPKTNALGQFISGCQPDPEDKKFMATEGYSAETRNSTDYSAFYRHARTFVFRSNPSIQVAGAPGTLYWDTGFNADTGDAVSGVPDRKAGSQANPTFGAHWENANEYCLPLKSGMVEEELHVIKPELKINGIDYETGGEGSQTVIPRLIVNSKKSYIDIDVTENAAAANNIFLQFSLNMDDPIDVLVCDLDKNAEYQATHTESENPLLWALSGCVIGNSKKNAIYFDTAHMSPPIQVPGSDQKYVRINMKIRKKGNYAIAVRARYKGDIWNGAGPIQTEDVTAWSDGINLKTVSVKSVNRNRT